MTLLGAVVILIIAGIVLFIVDRAPFIDAEAKVWIRWIIIAAMVIFLIWALLALTGVSVPNPRIK